MYGRLPGERSLCRFEFWELFWVAARHLDEKESVLFVLLLFFPFMELSVLPLELLGCVFSMELFTRCIDFLVENLV